MNKASRSVLQLVAVLLMAASLVLTACGDSTTPAPGTTAAGGSVAPGGVNTSVSGEIEMWHFWSSPQRRNAIRRVIAICNKQLPNLKVKDTVKPFGDIWTANTAAVAAGAGMPDVIVEDRPKLAQQAANNIETNLQTYVDRDKINSADYWPFTWKESQYNNGIYGIPYETDVRVLYWNKNAFKEAGLDPEKPPKTWDELEQYAAKLDKKNGDTYDRIGFFPLLGNGGGLQLWGSTNGVEWTKDGKPTVTDPKALETFQWLKKWVDKYGGWNAWQKYSSQFTSPPQDAFMSGKVAMYLDINGYASTLNFYRPQYTGADGKKANLDFGVGDLPYKTTPATSSGGFALSIPKGSKKADAAWEFIKCATSQEAQISWARDTGAMPANQKAANDPVLLADPTWQTMLNGMKITKNEDFVKGYSNWKEQLDKRFEKVWKGELDPKQALDEAQQAIDAEIAKNK